MISEHLSDALSQSIAAAARRIVRKFAPELARDGAAAKAARIFGLTLQPPKRAGRKRCLRVDIGARMKAQGRKWHQIYPEAISGYWSLSRAERTAEATEVETGSPSTRNASRARQTKCRRAREDKSSARKLAATKVADF